MPQLTKRGYTPFPPVVSLFGAIWVDAEPLDAEPVDAHQSQGDPLGCSPEPVDAHQSAKGGYGPLGVKGGVFNLLNP